MSRAVEPNSPQRLGRLISSWRAWLAGAVLVLLVAIVYWPTLDNGFFYDDRIDIQENLAMRSLQGLIDIWFKLGTFEQYYPLMYSTYWVEYHLWGPDPRGYHVVNFLLHATSAVLVWRLLLRLGVPGAWLAAAIFAVHPVGVESGAWVTERRNVLSCALALGSLLAYLRFSPAEPPGRSKAEASPQGDTWRYYAVALGLYMAALLSKTATASVPAVLLVMYWWKRGRVTWRDAARTAPFFAIGLALCGITLMMEKALGASSKEWNFSLVERVLIAGRALWFYAGKLVWPYPLIWFYPRWVIDARVWWQYVFPAAAVAVIVGLWLARTRIGRGPLAAVLIFAGVLVPVLGFFHLFMFRFTFVADHLQYHASIALIALATAAAVKVVARLPKPARWFAPVAGAGLLLPLAVMAQQKTHVWKNNMTVWEDAAALDPQSWMAHHSLGFCCENQGKYDEALSHFRKAVEIREQLARDNPTRSDYDDVVAAYTMHLGLLQRKMGRLAEAENSLRKAIEIREKLVRDFPHVADYQDSLAWCYVYLAAAQQQTGHSAEAEALHRKSLAVREKLAQDNPAKSDYKDHVAASYADVGLLQRARGRPAEAQSAFHRAIEIRETLIRDNPTVAEYQASLAASYQDLAISEQASGRPTEAEVSYRKAIEIRQKLARDNGLLTVLKRLTLIDIRQKLSQDNVAVSKYQDDLAASYVDLGLLQRARGRPAEAQSAFHRAIEIRETLVRDYPTVSDFQDGLAWCYVHLAIARHKAGRPAEAEVDCRTAIQIREKLAQDNPTIGKYKNNVAASYVDLGLLQRDTGRPAEAESSFQRAIEIRQQLVRDHPAASDYQDGLGWCYVHLVVAQFETGRPAEAEVSCRKAIAIREQLVRDNPTLGDYKHQLAVSYRDLGNLQRAPRRLAEAVVAYRKAIELREQLVRDFPTNAALQLNLASDLALYGDALATWGQWAESADRYAQAAAVGDDSWQTMGRLALVQLTAGNEAGYRATCADLVRRHAGNATGDAAVSVVLTLVVGERALDDMNPVLVLAKRAADADPSNPMAAILLGAAEYRAGRGQQAIATLTGTLSQLDPAAPSAAVKRGQALVGRLVGEMILALAYREHADGEALEKQLASLRELIDKTATPAPQNQGDLPPWAVAAAVEIAKRELAKLSVPPDVSPLGS